MVVTSNTTYYCDKCGKVVWSRENEEAMEYRDANENRVRMWNIKLKAMPVTSTMGEIREIGGLYYCPDCMGRIVNAMGMSWDDLDVCEYEYSERGN